MSDLSEESDHDDLEPFVINDADDVSDYVRNFASLADTHEKGQSCRVYWTQLRRGDDVIFRFSAVWNEVHCLVDLAVSSEEENYGPWSPSWVADPSGEADVIDDVLDSNDDNRPAVVNVFLDGFSAWYSESDDCEGDQLVSLSFQYVDDVEFEKAKNDEMRPQ